MDEIRNFNSWFQVDDPRLVAYANPSSSGDRTPPTGDVAAGPAVVARVNHSSWIADCPDVACAGAELVSLTQPVFFCCECRNRAVAHAFLPVVLPAKPADVEAALLERPDPSTRNWTDETVAVLKAETAAAVLPPDELKG